MKTPRVNWFLGGVLFWGSLWGLGSVALHGFVMASIIREICFFFVATCVLTLAVQELIGGFPSEWPAFFWFFYPVVSLLLTGVFVILT